MIILFVVVVVVLVFWLLLLLLLLSSAKGSCNWWFGFLIRIPENERDCYLGIRLESQTTGTQTTNLPSVDVISSHVFVIFVETCRMPVIIPRFQKQLDIGVQPVVL